LLEKPALSDIEIEECLRKHYGLHPASLDFLPLGNDAHSWVYRVTSEDGASYFFKLRQGALYPAAYLAPRFFKEQGITSVVAPLATTAGEAWTPLGDFTALLYPFIEGDNGWNTGMTGWHWQALGAALKSLHSLEPPIYLQETLRKESFDIQPYLGLHDLDRQLYIIMEGKDGLEREFMAIWKAKRPIIIGLLNQMVKLAAILRQASLPLVMCHADLHPGNILIDPGGALFIIDWDEVLLAPKERDFLFVETGNLADTAPPPFFQGYGSVDIDWPALAYYRCERVIQDVLAFAQEVFFRPDFGQENRASSVRWFGSIFEPEGEVELALATVRQLSSDPILS
jgi:spectinomycin phosphotransferase